MIREINLYKKYRVIQDCWYCFGTSSVVTIEEKKDIDEIKIKEALPKENEEKYSLYLLIDDKEKDKQFWKNAKDRNFVFISFFRINKKNEQLQKISKILGDTKEEENIVYESLDTYDLVIAHYNDSIEGIMEPFEKMVANGVKILETNSLVMTFSKHLNQCSDIKGELPKVSVRFRLKNLNEFSSINKYLCKLNYERTVRNGNYDYEYFKERVSIAEFFSIFNKHKVFDMHYDDVYKAIAEIEVRIYVEKELNEALIQVENRDKKFDIFESFNDLRRKFPQYITSDLVYLIDFMKECYQKDYYNDLFIVLYKPLEMFLSKYEEALTSVVNDLSSYEIIKDSYDLFINSIHEIFLIFNYSRVHTIRGFAYQGQKITIPFKLINYYTAFMYDLNDKLVENEKNEDEYEFCYILIPSTESDIHIQTLFNNDEYKKRLLLVNVPTEQITNIPLMLSQLSHEIGHYVCDKTRNRDSRKKYIMDAMVESLFNFIFMFEIEKDEKEMLYNFHEFLFQKLSILVHEENRTFMIQTVDVLDNFRETLIKTHPVIIKQALIRFYSKFDEFKDEFLKTKVKYVNVKEYAKKDKSLRDDLSKILTEISRILSSTAIENQLIFFLKVCDESFSDLISIKTQNLSVYEYFDIFNDRYFEIFGQDKPDFIISRIALVLATSSTFNLNQINTLNISNANKKRTINEAINLAKYIQKLDEYPDLNTGLREVEFYGYFPYNLQSYKNIHTLFLYLKECNLLLDEQYCGIKGYNNESSEDESGNLVNNRMNFTYIKNVYAEFEKNSFDKLDKVKE